MTRSTTTNTTHSCCRLLLESHEQTRQNLHALSQLIQKQTPPEQIQPELSRLQHELSQHTLIEAQGLFPVLNLYRPMFLLDVEHLHLDDALNTLGQLLNQTSPDWDTIQSLWNDFVALLEGHMLQEERDIFPLAHSVLEPEEQALVERKLSELTALSKKQGLKPTILSQPKAQSTPSLDDCHRSKPISISSLCQLEQTQIQLLQLTAKQQLKRHFSEQLQWLLVLDGHMQLISDSNTLDLTTGESVQLDSKLWFELQAITDSQVLVVKVWPKPYFSRQLPE